MTQCRFKKRVRKGKIVKFFILTLIAVPFGIVYGSFFEWTLHRFLMHRPLWGFRYAFEAHDRVHHRIFKADHTYHLQDGPEKEKHKRTIPMAWWNGPVLIVFATVLTIPLSWPLDAWWLSLGFVIALTLYYAAYEYLHWCMHLPKKRNIERTGIFFRLNGHHLIHHRYYRTHNFNVVLPLADWCLGTLLPSSKVSFKKTANELLEV